MSMPLMPSEYMRINQMIHPYRMVTFDMVQAVP